MKRRSIERHLPVGTSVDASALVWRYERSAPVVVVVAVAAVVVATSVAGGSPATTVLLAAGTAVLGAVGTAERRLVVATSAGLMLFRACRFRRRAIALIGPVSPLTIERVPGGSIAPQWYVDGQRYRAAPWSADALAEVIDSAIRR